MLGKEVRWLGRAGMGRRHHKLWERCGTGVGQRDPWRRPVSGWERGDGTSTCMCPPAYDEVPSPPIPNPGEVPLWSHRDRNATGTRNAVMDGDCAVYRSLQFVQPHTDSTQLPLGPPIRASFPQVPIQSSPVPCAPIRCLFGADLLWSLASPCHWP